MKQTVLKFKYTLSVLSIITVAGCLFWVLWRGLQENPNSRRDVLAGTKAAPFKIDALKGHRTDFIQLPSTLDLDLFKGKPLIINFWASWCASCKEEAAFLQEFWQEYHNQVYILGISVHDTMEDSLKLAQFVGKSYPLGVDSDGKVSLDYGVSGVPETVFIDSTGKIYHKEVGPVDKELLLKTLASLQEH